MLNRSEYLSALLAAALFCSPLYADEIQLKQGNLTLNANMQLVDEQPVDGRVALITHGTLAHNGMEIISTLQDLLADEELPSLAINLSLGLDNRHGMYDCAKPHNHKHTDAVSEINLWLEWLKNQGADEIVLIGHSRGGNQTAWYSNLYPETAIAQVLVAPATWSESDARESYKQRYGQSLQSVLSQAEKMQPQGIMETTNFIYCAETQVTAGSFINYYQPDTRFNTPTLLQQTALPSLVIIGSEDNTVSNLSEAMAEVDNANIASLLIEDADHYFRDLYADEMVEGIIEFLEQL
jgi:pimeloyl-ACP methyl ester carboxylesterase